MACYHPLSAWVHKTRKSDTGKSIVVFSAPSNIMDYRSVQVPCGRCIGCKLDYSRMWATRCMNEVQMHEKNCFITLTYDDEHVPWSNVTGEQTLRKRDLQLFWKRLRKKIGKFRYFACGEYGDNTYRPHYHAIIFGADFDDKFNFKLSSVGFNYYLSATLAETWENGLCSCADVSWDTCAYVARYCIKKLSGEPALEKYKGIEKEFVVMSRRPGIGFHWYKKYKGDIFPYDEVVLADHGRIRHLRVPRYYDNLLAVDLPEELEVIKEKRIRVAEQFEEENSFAGRLDQKEEFKILQTQSLIREL